MSTIIAKTMARGVLIICMLFSIYLLLNGGNYPGGGFVGGVLFVCAIALVYVTYGMKYINTRLKPDWIAWIAYGLLFASITAVAPLLVNYKYFRSAFEFFHLEFLGIDFGHIELHSAIFFDIGVYFTVIGVLLFILTNIASDKVKESENFETEQDGEEEYTLKPKTPSKSTSLEENNSALDNKTETDATMKTASKTDSENVLKTTPEDVK
jgi:Multisubunit Na+/H+ antiporter, MnhB subunit